MAGDLEVLQETESATVGNSQLILPGRGNSLDIAAALLPPPDLNLIDLELLMHWKDTTYQIFCRNPRASPIWQSLVPQEALTEPFLMHGILALSSLHLARTKSDYPKSLRYIGTAVSHQNQALATFRPSLDNINPSNSKAMFAFASIITVSAFGFPRASASDFIAPWAAIDDLYQAITFARGAHYILVQAAESLRNSMFRPLLQWDGLGQRLTEEARLAFERLYEEIHTLAADELRCDYLRAIECMQEGLAEILGGSTALAVASRVAIRIPARYMDLLREHDPLALTILVYYCTILHRLRHNWCLEGWGARVAGALWSVLGGQCQWRDLMRWAMEDIFGLDFCIESTWSSSSPSGRDGI